MKSNYLKFSLFLLASLCLFVPSLIWAQSSITTFQTLPYVDGPISDTQTYIELLYRLSIAVAAFLVIFKIILAGARLTVSDSVSGRSKAKEDIFGALLGMLIILGAVTILNTINPNLTNLNFLQKAQPIIVNPKSGATSGPSTPINFKPGQNLVFVDEATYDLQSASCISNGGTGVDILVGETSSGGNVVKCR